MSAGASSGLYEFALESLGIASDEALAIEGSLGGAEATLVAGTDTIGYLGCIALMAAQS